MKDFSTVILSILFFPILVGCILFISLMFTHFEPSYISLKLGQISNPLPDLHIGILSLVLPAYYVMTLIAFMIIGIFVFEFNKKLQLNLDMQDLQSLFFIYCPMGVTLSVLTYRIYMIQNINFLNRYDLLGIILIIILHGFAVLSIRNEDLFYKVMAILKALKKLD